MIDWLRYHYNVNMLGRPALRLHRWYSQSNAKKRWKSKILTPPLNISARAKEMIIFHYLKGRYANLHGKVAWVTSGAPVEYLRPLGYYLFYPENHGAVCGTTRKAVEISTEAENAGYSCDICSYARTDIGAMISGKTPLGRIPRPDLLVTCTNICQTVLYWYKVLAHHFKVPLIVIDTPFIYDKLADYMVTYVQKQIEQAVTVAEKVAKRTLDMNKFTKTMELSRKACELWLQVMEMGKNRPAPLSVFDQFILMAPIVEMRGNAATVDFYGAMLRELKQRVAKGVGVIQHERKRLLWDNLPIWYRLRYLAEFLGEHGIAIVVSTYTNAWGEIAHLIDPRNPFESMARTYISPMLNQGSGHKLSTIVKMVENYSLDGVILHSNRSCKPYSIGQLDQKDRLSNHYNMPTLLLEADHNDSRMFSKEQVATRLAAFVEMLE